MTPHPSVTEGLMARPFCGSDKITLKHGADVPGWDEDVSAYVCGGCEASGPTIFRRRGADEDEGPSWNRRAPQPVAGPIADEGATPVQEARESAVHDLKCWPGPFEEMRVGRKRFEYRKNDRDYREGDILHLREWCEPGQYTGRVDRYLVEYVLGGGQFGVPDDYCVMSVLSESTKSGPFGFPFTNQGDGLAGVEGAADGALCLTDRQARKLFLVAADMRQRARDVEREQGQYAELDITGEVAALRAILTSSPPPIPPELAELSEEPAAWLHTMHTEGDQTSVRVSLDEDDPWGEPGEDYSEEFVVQSEPLYVSASLPASTGRKGGG